MIPAAREFNGRGRRGKKEAHGVFCLLGMLLMQRIAYTVPFPAKLSYLKLILPKRNTQTNETQFITPLNCSIKFKKGAVLTKSLLRGSNF